MKIIVIFLNRFFDVLWKPLAKSFFYADIIIISAISALIFLIIFKHTSNQKKIHHYKNKILAYILEIRLYKDQPILTIKNILFILGNNFIYLRYTLIPMIAIIPLLLIISVQLNNRYGYSPLEIDNRFIIRADLDKTIVSDIGASLERIRCDTSKGLFLETSPIRIASEASIFWRAKIISQNSGRHFCKIVIAGTDDTVSKDIFTYETRERFSPERCKWQLRCLFVNNAEDFIPETSPFKAVSVTYARATYSFLGWHIDSIILYFILTLLFGFAFKPILKVNI
jgi:hypothetical protein